LLGFGWVHCFVPGPTSAWAIGIVTPKTIPRKAAARTLRLLNFFTADTSFPAADFPRTPSGPTPLGLPASDLFTAPPPKQAAGAGIWHPPAVRFGVVLLLLVLSVAPPAAGRALRSYWPMAKLMRAIDDVRVRVGTRVVRIHRETTLCSGEGPSIRRRGIRRWSRFACTYTTFTKQGVDRDVDFRVRVTGVRRFVISDAHWVRVTR
jgi:hypothetical protein